MDEAEVGQLLADRPLQGGLHSGGAEDGLSGETQEVAADRREQGTQAQNGHSFTHTPTHMNHGSVCGQHPHRALMSFSCSEETPPITGQIQ